MNIPSISCSMEVFCSVNPSEDPKKIEIAVSNIFPYSSIKIKSFLITAKSHDLRSLEKIYEAIHTTRSQKIYRRYLEKNLDINTTWFYLNKQAAFVDKIAICEESEESTLGPIKVVLTSLNLNGIIDWLVFSHD